MGIVERESKRQNPCYPWRVMTNNAIRNGVDCVVVEDVTFAFQPHAVLAGRGAIINRGRRKMVEVEEICECSDYGIPELMSMQARIAELVAAGLSNAEIAKVVGLSQKSVDNAIYRIYRRLGIDNRVQLLCWWLKRNGIEVLWNS